MYQICIKPLLHRPRRRLTNTRYLARCQYGSSHSILPFSIFHLARLFEYRRYSKKKSTAVPVPRVRPRSATVGLQETNDALSVALYVSTTALCNTKQWCPLYKQRAPSLPYSPTIVFATLQLRTSRYTLGLYRQLSVSIL